jgi:uncharacterized protein YwgA
MGKITSCKDLLMLLLYAKGHTGKQCEPIQGRTRLMKMVFLFDREIRQKLGSKNPQTQSIVPDFAAYDYGPFSPRVFSDIDFLTETGFVESCPLSEDGSLPEEAFEYNYWQAGAQSDDDVAEIHQQMEFGLTGLGRGFVEERLRDILTAGQWEVVDEFKKRCTSVPLRALLKYVYTKYEDMTRKSKIRDEILSDYKY